MRRFAAVRSAGLWLGFVGIAALWLNAASAASTALSEGSITFEGEPPSLSEAELRFAATEPGVSAWNEEQAEAPDGSYVPDIAWHEHLAEKYGVSIEAAAQIGEWESTAMVQTTDALHNEFGDQVIQYRVSPPDFEIEVFTFLDESTIDEFVDTLSLPPPTVVTTTTNLVPAAAVNELRAQLLMYLEALTWLQRSL